MFNKLEKYQINGNIVGSVSGFQVDNSDPENVVILETANIDGSNTIGGVWWIDRILSDRFTGEKQVLHALSNNTIEWGNIELDKHIFLVDDADGLKIKVGGTEGTIWNTLNLTDVSQLNNDAGYLQANDLDGYLPLAGGTMNGSINWNSVNLGITYNSNLRFRLSTTSSVLSANTSSSAEGVIIRPRGDTSTSTQTVFSGDGFIRTSDHGNSSQWKQAYDWGDFRDFGLGVTSQSHQATLDGNIPSSLYTFSTTSQTVGAPYDYGGVLTIRRGSNEFVQLALPVQDSLNKPPMYRGRISTGEWGWRCFITELNLDTEATSLGFIKSSALGSYVLQSSLNTQLANYVPINGVTTINNTKTFTSSPVVPNGTLNGHAVNLGQLNNALDGNYLPLAGGTMNNGSVINWNSGTSAVIQQGGNNRIRVTFSNTFISSSVSGTTDGIYLRPRGDINATGQVRINGNGQITTHSHGNSSQWYEAYLAIQNLPQAEQDILFSTDFNTADVVTLNNPTIFYFTSFVDQLDFQVGSMRKGDELVVHNTSGVVVQIKINTIRQDGNNTGTEYNLLRDTTTSFVLAYISGNPYFAIKHKTDIPQ